MWDSAFSLLESRYFAKLHRRSYFFSRKDARPSDVFTILLASLFIGYFPKAYCRLFAHFTSRKVLIISTHGHVPDRFRLRVSGSLSRSSKKSLSPSSMSIAATVSLHPAMHLQSSRSLTLRLRGFSFTISISRRASPLLISPRLPAVRLDRIALEFIFTGSRALAVTGERFRLYLPFESRTRLHKPVRSSSATPCESSSELLHRLDVAISFVRVAWTISCCDLSTCFPRATFRHTANYALSFFRNNNHS